MTNEEWAESEVLVELIKFEETCIDALEAETVDPAKTMTLINAARIKLVTAIKKLELPKEKRRAQNRNLGLS